MIPLLFRSIAFGASLVGCVLVGSKTNRSRLYGFSIWIFSNILWLGNATTEADWPQIGLWLAFILFSIRGMINNVHK